MARPERYAKLDNYNYKLYYVNDRVNYVYIKVDRTNSVEIADIATEVNGAEGNIYVEGHYLKFVDMKVEHDNTTREVFLRIAVREV